MLLSHLSRKASSVAALLQRAGALPRRPVAAVTASAPVLAILAHAAPLLRAPLFPIDPALPAAVIADLLAQAGMPLVVGDGQYGESRVVASGDILAAEEGPIAASQGEPQEIALLVATSGSTGRPKAVMLTAGNLRAAALASAAATPLTAGDRWLACLPLFHIGGYSILSRCAMAGAEAVIHEGFDAERVADAIGRERISHLSLVPAMLAQLLDRLSPPPTLRHVLVGGAALSAELATRAAEQGWPIQPTYGMSETASQFATLPSLPRPWRPGFVGPPLPGGEATLTPEGRLKVRGPMVMAGYANAALVPGEGLEDGWFVTNDLAEINADGGLTILGRADDVIVSGGKKVQPRLVEEALARCPGLHAVGIIGRADPVWGEVVTAVFVGDMTEAALLDWCRANVAGALRPRAAVRVARLPLLASGKPDRAALRQLAAGNEAQTGTLAEQQPPADQ